MIDTGVAPSIQHNFEHLVDVNLNPHLVYCFSLAHQLSAPDDKYIDIDRVCVVMVHQVGEPRTSEMSSFDASRSADKLLSFECYLKLIGRR